jgi:NAD(P)-dependent dehydrogenase (short-subunit alcohol dehydrogenase family)
MSRCLALELGPHKIRVNIVQPALMQTVMCKELLDGFPTIPGNEELDGQLLVDVLKSRTPTQVPMMPLDQMVNTILFMLSDLAPQITGQTLTVDGGFMVT